MRYLFALLLLLAPSLRASSLGSPVTGSSFEALFVEIPISGGDGDEIVTVDFSPTGENDWSPSMPVTYDRRASITQPNGTVRTNPNANKVLVPIIGRTHSTTYDVRVTLDDPDGVTGSNPVTTSVTTKDITPVVGASTIWVNDDYSGTETGSQSQPYNTLTEAEAALSNGAGGTIKIMPGTYAAITVTKDGSANTWVKWEAQAGGAVVVGGGSTSITSTADYRWFQGITVAASTNHGFSFSSNTDTLIDGCLIPNPGTSPSYNDSGIFINANAANVRVIGTTINRTTASTNETFGIYVSGSSAAGGLIVQDCVISGNFRDGIAAEGEGYNSGTGKYVHIKRTSASGVSDDAMELEGNNIFMVEEQNSLTSNGYAILGSAGTFFGPAYHIRSIYRSTTGRAWSKDGNYDYGYEYYYHCTVDVTGTGGDRDAWANLGGAPYSILQIGKNNVIRVPKRIVALGQVGAIYNRNYYVSGFETFATNWGGTSWSNGTTYATLAAWRTGTGNDLNSLTGAHPWTNPTAGNYILVDGSTAIDAAEVIPNVNDASSEFPYGGAGPDMGALEKEIGTGGGGGEEPDPDETDPTIQITSPTSSATDTTSTATYQVGGIASDETALASVTLVMTGATTGSVTVSGTGTWTGASVTLNVGVTTFTATATDTSNNTAQDTLAVTLSPGDTTAPTVASVAINATGTQLVITLDEATTRTAGTPTISLTGGDITAAYASGSGTTVLRFNLSRTAYAGQTGDASCTLSAGQWTDAAGNSVASWGPVAITNASTVATPVSVGGSALFLFGP